MDTTDDACLYRATVMHRRRVAPFYRFVYRVFYLLVDVDRVDAVAARHRCFSHNRFNLLALHDRDHGDGLGLRPWAEAVLRAHGVALAGGRIRLLAFPRVLGRVFNPISLWYCEHADGTLRAVIAEVNNTFGEKHSYVLASDGAPLPYGQMPEKEKCFHVSPFFAVAGRYRFELGEPGARLRVAIHLSDAGMPQLDATISAERRALRDTTIARQVLGLPWLAAKVVVAIHWQALKIWLHGARFHRKPAPPSTDIS
ncbi:DUF1365 domain-containing protein [Solimonas marina]|uniref:DUF1365 domain-containing protein n=1 Tax=Solimonas marina TaxID=2714601 RepID=A0A969W5Y4_9GAMM|nr:DUF1365 domain-containing protein [Solimonas marina]NKF21266.1 DUF1365 domain-containing protein [Solimonas marina]